MESSAIAAVRDIFVIVAASVLAAAGITAIVLVAKLFRPLRETMENTAVASRNLRKVSENLAAVSEETAANAAQTARNAAVVSERLKEGSEELPETIRTAREAAANVAETASSVTAIARTVGRFTSLGMSGGGTASGTGPLLRILRNVFGGSRRSDDGGFQSGA